MGREGEAGVLECREDLGRRWKRAKARSRELYSELNDRLSQMEAAGMLEREYRARKRELLDVVEAEMEGHWRGYYRSFDTCNSELGFR